MASASHSGLEFERPLLELEERIEELRRLSVNGQAPVREEISKLERKSKRLERKIFSSLEPWQVVQLARHPNRPYSLDYVNLLTEGFVELHGDRRFGDDKAIVAGFGFFRDEPVCLIGHQKGRGTKDNIARHFGMPRPEGHRKAQRVMELAARLGRPVITFIDTPGAYPGIEAEERGQAESIAKSMEVMTSLPVPVISVVIGEGGSGGALSLGLADRLLMLQHSFLSVISPEACSSILFRDTSMRERAARELRLTAKDLHSFGISDEVVKEPLGGAHRDHAAAGRLVARALARHLDELRRMSVDELLAARYEKYRSVGAFLTRKQ